MAHEITKTDGLVLHSKAAWHGLGTVVENAPTPDEALTIAGLRWSVESEPLFAYIDSEPTLVPDMYANIRSDNKAILGIVSDQYTPIQNTELAAFISAVGTSADDVRIESAGSFLGGKRVFFLVKGESFSIGDDDLIVPYVMISNGHDGNHGFHVRPTSVRVVCANTQRMAMARGAHLPHFTAQHRGDVKEHLETAKAVIHLFRESTAGAREVYSELSKRGLDQETLVQFATDCYRRDFPLTTKAQKEKRLMDRYLDREKNCIKQVETIFETESDRFGSNRWIMLNAYTRWLQHRPERKGDDRGYSNWLGYNASRSDAALTLALSV